MRAKRIQVTVTKGDIENGIPCDGECCPIANAAMRKADRVMVGDGNSEDGLDAHIKIDGTYFRHTPKSLRFIKRFDDGKKVRPTTFRFTEIRQ